MDELINEMRKYAKEYHIPIMDQDGLNFMSDYIVKNNIKTILELGSAIGYSAIMMAKLNPEIKIVTVERDINRYRQAIENIKNAHLEDQITIHLADALEFDTPLMFDMIFIDAAKAQYIKFFERFKGNLNKEGAIISDNLNFHGLVNNHDLIRNRNTKQLVQKIEKYISFLENNDEFKTTFNARGDGVAISIRK